MATTHTRHARPQPSISHAQQKSANLIFRIVLIALAIIAAIYAFDTYDHVDANQTTHTTVTTLPAADVTPRDNTPVMTRF